MRPEAKARTGVTFIDLEFDTGAKDSVLLGDIAASLVSLDELLRDLASVFAYPSSAEFRTIEIVAIEMRHPLRIRLSLFAISEDAVKAFQAICRDIIHKRPVNINIGLELSEKEEERMHGQIVTLQNAEVPLTRVEVKEE